MDCGCMRVAGSSDSCRQRCCSAHVYSHAARCSVRERAVCKKSSRACECAWLLRKGDIEKKGQRESATMVTRPQLWLKRKREKR